MVSERTITRGASVLCVAWGEGRAVSASCRRIPTCLLPPPRGNVSASLSTCNPISLSKSRRLWGQPYSPPYSTHSRGTDDWERAAQWRSLYLAVRCLPAPGNLNLALNAASQEVCFVSRSRSLHCSSCRCRHQLSGQHSGHSHLTLLRPSHVAVRLISLRDRLRSSSSAESQIDMCPVRGHTS